MSIWTPWNTGRRMVVLISLKKRLEEGISTDLVVEKNRKVMDQQRFHSVGGDKIMDHGYCHTPLLEWIS
ncbi:MAG: hypothetical protein M1483_07630 [Actinobacteria bacterium]|nr:hypothetical protein [Actinomycetota bacterium]MCL6105479.1 hypothetical protein [Actinomycetota bacterium]